MAYDFTDKDQLVVFAVYDHPKDYPDDFVVRRHILYKDGVTEPDENIWMNRKNVEDIRKQLFQVGLVNIGREPDDDPVILECWV